MTQEIDDDQKTYADLLGDWIDLIDRHDETAIEQGLDTKVSFALTRFEAQQLRYDLQLASNSLRFKDEQLEQLSAYVKRYEAALDRTMALVESYKELNAKTTDIARRAISAIKKTAD